MEGSQQVFKDVTTGLGGDVIPIICGTFTSIYIYILSFSSLTRQLSITRRIPAHGPHQYLALSPGRGTVYATSWQTPARLWSWDLQEVHDGLDLVERGSTPITAVSSYITVTNSHVYSVGGPTGEIHETVTGADASNRFGRKVQELVYVPDDELAGWDKTNKALRYGSHGIEFDAQGRAYVPDLGANAIWVHQPSAAGDGSLELLAKVDSPREHDGPRHAVVSKDGKMVYAVTEHTQYLDVYDIVPTGLAYRHSASLLSATQDPHDFRGDTVRVSHVTPFVFATTRGKDASVRGLLIAFELDSDPAHAGGGGGGGGGALLRPGTGPTATFETPTSGGKANAIEVLPARGRGQAGENEEWLVLTDSEQGLVLVISWDGKRFEEVSRVQLEQGDGASHAVWVE